jgi:thioredoxin-like negative regulator of GroEL
MESIYNLELLKEKVAGEEGLLIYFSNESCSVCKVLRPKVSELLSHRFPKLSSYYVDIDKSPLLSGQYRIFTIPSILIFFQGKEYFRFSRSFGLHQLLEAIEKPYYAVFEN